MGNAAMKSAGNFLGFATALELKDFIVSRHRSTLKDQTVALVKDSALHTDSLFILARGKFDRLFLILPDSKELCVATVRQQRRDVPFVFEVLA